MARPKRRLRLIEYFNEQSGLCAYCCTQMTKDTGYANTATIDHIIPRSKGGQKGRHNEICVCSACNSDKTDMDLIKWLREPIRRIFNAQTKYKDRYKTPDFEDGFQASGQAPA